MAEPAVLLLVRFKSRLSLDEVNKVMNERAPEFRALPGLQQKYYLQETESGDYAGLYLWESPEALSEYQKSELKASIGEAYQVEGEPRVEVYRVLMPLRS